MATLALTAALTFGPVATDIQPPCPEPLIHTWGVLCVTQAEYDRLWGITPPEPAPISVELVGEPLARYLVERYFPAWAVADAMKVIGCETGWTFDPASRNRYSGASGLFQHMPRYWTARSSAAGWPNADIFDAEANVAVAAWLWGQTGTWQHWSCRP